MPSTARALRVPMLAVLALLLTTTAASADTFVWGSANSGDFDLQANWSQNGVAATRLPNSSDDVFIANPGTYTVTVNGAPRTVGSLTLGAASGTGSQRLVVRVDNGTNTGSEVSVANASTITATGELVLEQDATGAAGGVLGAKPTVNYSGTLTNNGTIVARSIGGQATSNELLMLGLGANGILVNNGTIHAQSGRFHLGSVTTSGAVQVDAAGSIFADAGSGRPGWTVNGGTIVNNGTFQTSGLTAWTQNGGAASGNPIRMDTPFPFTDAGGTGTFELIGNGARIVGTVPAGQTVRLGYEENSNIFNVQAGGLVVAAGGTLILDASPGNGANLAGQPVTVNGTLRPIMRGAVRPRIESALTIGAGGQLDVAPATTLSLAGVATNGGTVTIPATSRVELASSTADNLVNGAGGMLAFQIASATVFGRIATIGGGRVASIAGTANGVLTGGYAPPVGTAFKVIEAPVTAGAFAAVGGNFTATLPADRSSLSLVYQGKPPAVDKAAPVISLARLAKATVTKGTRPTLKLTLSEKASLTVTVTQRVPGRKVAGKCKAGAKHGRRCTATVTRATLRPAVVKGANSLRLALQKLKAGTYKIAIVARDTAGNKSVTRTLKLVVKAPPKKR